ncbi:hypothetical protein [Inquilinus limosus]|uniref:hypothetical protein n=1 Tax=Inquilinus limosus TaxID=171674 RepID=UPI00119822D7|nr:hypothetical protein [Inquilinus limosus]
MSELPGEHRYKRALMLLSTACLGSTGSVLHLVEGMRLWDAELILRSVSEGTAKFAYLLENQATFTERCIEYRDVLPLIARRRRHTKAAEALNALRGASDLQTRPYRDLLLTDDELADIEAKYPRDVRRRMETRWGFSALVEAISKPDGVFGLTARALLHGYSVASDLQHMSFDGTEMPLERDMRSVQRRKAIELAHAAKLISSCYHLTWLRIRVLLRFLNRPADELLYANVRNAALLAEFDQAESHWSEIEYPTDISAKEPRP